MVIIVLVQMSVAYQMVITALVQIVQEYPMVITLKIIVAHVMLIALMTVYRIVQGFGAVVLQMMSVVYVVVITQLVRTVLAYQMVKTKQTIVVPVMMIAEMIVCRIVLAFGVVTK